VESGFSRKFCPSAQDWGQILAFEGQTCSRSRSFTSTGPQQSPGTWQSRGGEAQGSSQLESPNRSPRHLPANRESSPIAMCACQPSAAAPRPRPLRCGPGFTHHSVSRLRSAAKHPQGLALTREWYTGCARTGGSFVVNVVDRSASVKSR
jgi:hypothetical protein